MFNSLLIKGEVFKLVKSKSFSVSLIILILIILVSAWISWESKKNGDWKERYSTEIKNDTELVSQETDKDNPFVQKINSDISIKQYHLDNNIVPSEEGNALGFVKKYSGITSFISIVIMIYASNMITKEINWGTLKMLLMRPISKSSIILSKYCSLLLIGLCLYIGLFLLLIIFGSIVYGLDNFTTKIIFFDKGIVEGNILYEIFKQILYNYILLATYASLALMISVTVNNSAISIMITLLVFVFGGTISSYLEKYNWSKYIIFSNLDIATGNPGNEIAYFSLNILICYIILFLFLALIIFNRKQID